MENDINSVVLKNVADENDILFSKYLNNRIAAHRNDIVNKYIYLAEIISRKFLNRGLDYEDIFQVACIALIKAVERFDPGKGVKFVSFATPTIIGEIKRYFRDKGSVIRIPRRIYEVYQKVNHAREYLSHELQRIPRGGEIVRYGDYKITIVDIEGKRISKVKLEKVTGAPNILGESVQNKLQ